MNMDRRDWPHWIEAAKRRYARIEMSMAQAAAYPNMESQDRTNHMHSLVNIINGPQAIEDNQPTPEQEAEWAKNREELAAMFGRIK